MAVVRATLDNSSVGLLKRIQNWVSVSDFSIQSANQPYSTYSWNEVIKHDKKEDCWIVIHGKVYNVTKWIPKHPGGKIILDGAGGDCTGAWESYHPNNVLQRGVSSRYLIGEIRDYEDFYSWDGDFYKTVKERVEAYLPRNQRRDDPRMNIKGICILILYFISLLLYVIYCQWWTAIFWGLMCSQVGVNIMHDGNHGAFTSGKTLTWIAGHTLDLVGSSSVVYRRSHNYGHHSCVNHYELDRAFDTTYPWLRLHQNQPRQWFHNYQHLYGFFLYFLVNFGDLFGTFDEFFWMSNYPNRRGNVGFSAFVFHVFVKISWLFYAILIPSYLHGYVSMFPVWFLYFITFSIGYSLFFAVNHWTLDAGFVDNEGVSQNNWGVLQVSNSINFANDSPFWTFLTGGLNFQIEHHLFPGMVHTRLPEIAPIVRKTCEEFGIAYFQYKTFWHALYGHYRLLQKLGQHDTPTLVKEN